MKTTILLLFGMVMPYLGYAQCVTDEDKNVWTESWLSCESSPLPSNPSESTHWVQYDLGQVYQIDSLHLWNYNIDSLLVANGVNQFIISSSLDSMNWTRHGSFGIGPATGSSTYLGQSFEFSTPITSQYLLMELESNHGGSCIGFSEIAFGVLNDSCSNFVPEVLAEYEICHDLFTLYLETEVSEEELNIMWSNGSNGTSITDLQEGYYSVTIEHNECIQFIEIELMGPQITVEGWNSGDTIPGGTYTMSNTIQTSGNIEESVDFYSNGGIELEADFQVASNSILQVYLVDCQNISDYAIEQSRVTPRSNKVTFRDYIGAGHSYGVNVVSSGSDDPITTINGSNNISTCNNSRFLTQATFGLNSNMLEDLSQMGFEPWIDWQLSVPHESYFNHLYFISKFNQPNILYWTNWHRTWWNNVLTGDQFLRDRMAFALSQVLVISSKSFLQNFGDGLTAYYDVLSENAFGNYKDLLLEITINPMMGFYLSHLNNPKTDTQNNVFPDENYAREILQLFSIGLYELNIDGSRKKDGQGRDIPTYDNDDIIEFAKVFTGLSLANKPFGRSVYLANNRVMRSYMTESMQMNEEHHEPGEKHLLNGFIIPAGQSGMEDIENAIDNIFNHPNVGPFLSRRLIQRFVKSHPTPAYIQRVAQTFNDNGEGIRGDLGAVLKAILLDPEARDTEWLSDPEHGKLKEPILRFSQLYKAFELTNSTGTFYTEGLNIETSTGQAPLRAPSVFNFYQSDYSPPGVLSDVSLEAPEFQILNSSTSIGYINMLDSISVFDHPMKVEEGDVNFQLEDELELADNPTDLVNHLNQLLTFGTLETSTVDIIKDAIGSIPGSQPLERVKLGIYLVSMTPEYVILK